LCRDNSLFASKRYRQSAPRPVAGQRPEEI